MQAGLEGMAGSGAVIELSDPLFEPFQRGAEIKREILKAEGGALSAQEFSKRLGITPLSLAIMRKREEVFWLSHESDYVYPSFQLGSEGQLPNIREALDAFVVDAPLMRVNFILTDDMRLGG